MNLSLSLRVAYFRLSQRITREGKTQQCWPAGLPGPAVESHFVPMERTHWRQRPKAMSQRRSSCSIHSIWCYLQGICLLYSLYAIFCSFLHAVQIALLRHSQPSCSSVFIEQRNVCRRPSAMLQPNNSQFAHTADSSAWEIWGPYLWKLPLHSVGTEVQAARWRRSMWWEQTLQNWEFCPATHLRDLPLTLHPPWCASLFALHKAKQLQVQLLPTRWLPCRIRQCFSLK